MVWSYRNINPRLFTPLKMGLLGLFALALICFWQYLQLNRKNHAIVALINENDELKKTLLAIDADLMEIKDTASDVRLFQREMVKVIKDIDAKSPVSLSQEAIAKPSCGFDEQVNFDLPTIIKNTRENILLLSSSQHKQRFDMAGLLGRAVFMRNILSNTPSLKPVSDGYITSRFGFRKDPVTGGIKHHNGVDIAAPIGTPVFASADGRVVMAGQNKSLGNVIELLHADGFVTVYGHLSQILVTKGEHVERGQQIGRVGNTGSRCVGAHLHYGISQNGVKQNPEKFMKMAAPVFF